jgi:hypothetical protein
VRIVASARRRGKTVRVARRVLRVTGRRAVSVPLTRAGRALLRADRAVAVTLRVKRAGRTTSRRIVLR